MNLLRALIAHNLNAHTAAAAGIPLEKLQDFILNKATLTTAQQKALAKYFDANPHLARGMMTITSALPPAPRFPKSPFESRTGRRER